MSGVRREMGPPAAKHKAAKKSPDTAAPKALETRAPEASKKAPTAKPSKRAAVSAGTANSEPMPAIRLTHPDKIVDPQSGITKQQLAEYLWAVSAAMLPHIADRPLSLVRCPEGAAKPCFYQKHVNHLLPRGVGSVMVSDKKGGKPEPYITLNDPEALAGLAQMSVLEIHPWGSTNDDLEHPNRIIFDLDPDEALPWQQICEAALEVRALLGVMKLQSFVKTTGGKGLHVAFPLQPVHDFATMKAWAHGLVEAMERDQPKRYLTKMTKAARSGKIYLDYLRNERGATAVAPYSMRARAGCPVSVPLEWKELEGVTERPTYSIQNFADWRHRLDSNPWNAMLSLRQKLPQAALDHFLPKPSRA